MPSELVSVPKSASVKVASRYSELALASVIDPALLKFAASMVTASPLETARVPELVNVVGAIVSAPPLEAAVIVPLLVKELPLMTRSLPVPDCLMAP